MEELMREMKLGAALFAGAATAVFGGADAWLGALLTVLVLDYLTGVGSAWAKGTLDSRTGAKGIMKKVAVLCIAALSVRLDAVMGTGGVLRSMVMGFYLANDALSILENAAEMGVPVPKAMTERLNQLKREEEKRDGQ